MADFGRIFAFLVLVSVVTFLSIWGYKSLWENKPMTSPQTTTAASTPAPELPQAEKPADNITVTKTSLIPTPQPVEITVKKDSRPTLNVDNVLIWSRASAAEKKAFLTELKKRKVIKLLLWSDMTAAERKMVFDAMPSTQIIHQGGTYEMTMTETNKTFYLPVLDRTKVNGDDTPVYVIRQMTASGHFWGPGREEKDTTKVPQSPIKLTKHEKEQNMQWIWMLNPKTTTKKKGNIFESDQDEFEWIHQYGIYATYKK